MIDLTSVIAALDGRAEVLPPVLAIAIDDDDIEVALGDVEPADAVRRRWTFPVGVGVLRRDELGSDPPRPEELTNAIGRVVDHIDDAVREMPDVMQAATVVCIGDALETVAAVEVGRRDPDELQGFVLERAAAEDVFRTLATEDAAARAHNPGLLPSEVDRSVAGCCALVGVMRRLHVERVIVAAPQEPRP